jgi:hypothetical protein
MAYDMYMNAHKRGPAAEERADDWFPEHTKAIVQNGDRSGEGRALYHSGIHGGIFQRQGHKGHGRLQ